MRNILLLVIILLLLIIISLAGCTTTKPYVPKKNVKAVKVIKGETLVVPFDGWVVTKEYLYRVIIEEERKDENR